MAEGRGTSKDTPAQTTTHGPPSGNNRRRTRTERNDESSCHSPSTSQRAMHGILGGVTRMLSGRKPEEPIHSSSDSIENLAKARDSRPQKAHEASATRAGAEAHGAHVNNRAHKRDTGYLHEIKQRDVQIEECKAKCIRLRQESEAQSQRLAEESRQHEKDRQQQQAAYEDHLQQCETQIRKLNKILSQLLEDNEQLRTIVIARQENALQSMVSNNGRAPKEDRVVRDEFTKLDGKMRSWARNYGVKSLSDLEGVPDNEKDKVIKELGEYCREQDWASLMCKVSFSPDKVPGVLLQALLAKDVFERIFVDPFFAFGKIGDDNTLPEPAELNRIYGCMKQGKKIIAQKLTNANRNSNAVHEAEAHTWRSQTLRILSTATDPNTKPILQERIEELSSGLVTNLLGSSARTLLQSRNTEDAKKMNQELQSLYAGAAHLALSLWSQPTFMVCRSQQHLPVFTITNPMMTAHRLHHLDEDDCKLDGKQVLLVIRPVVLAFGTVNAEHYDLSKVWARATVLVNEKS
ncbi:hypothetical protein BDV23DRAFT_144369 [Aspergillus alliaceus]|uniref:Uncharacterized protein n=1 Tax=Petromyces alliaceus TaxID=209559 RepID=A0A5N7CPA4_PETAA|nr:hypothetical protein BDV23DRAFT_144369 [Aspergillus alliaceus]